MIKDVNLVAVLNVILEALNKMEEGRSGGGVKFPQLMIDTDFCDVQRGVAGIDCVFVFRNEEAAKRFGDSACLGGLS